jgi:membrane protein
MDSEDQQAITSLWKLRGLTWRDLGRRIWLEIYAGDLFSRAAALSYYFLLALFPLLLFLLALLGSFAETGTELRNNLFRYLSQLVPGSAFQLIDTTITEVSLNAGGGKLSFGLLTALWFASNGMGAITDTLNATYGVKDSRPWWKVRLVAVGLTAALGVLIVSALTLLVYGGEIGNSVASALHLGNVFAAAWNLLQWPIVLSFVLFAFALVYYFAPDLEHQKWYWITPGSVAGVGLWLLVSFGLRLYLHYFNRYSVTYGSLGAVIILMLWFYLMGMAILIGGKINAEIEHAAAEEGAPGAKLPGEKSAPE